jgi:cytoskeletal protein RodZ
MIESIGETLREARHNKKASLEDVARITKIKLEILEKLEADEFDRLASPMYTKGFLKLYAEYLGLDPVGIVDAYVKSQGGFRRTGLQVETEAAVRAKRPRELQLPLRQVVRVVLALTLAVVLGFIGRHFWVRRAHTAATVPAEAKSPTLPRADFDAIYQPKNKPAPEVLDVHER